MVIKNNKKRKKNKGKKEKRKDVKVKAFVKEDGRVGKNEV